MASAKQRIGKNRLVAAIHPREDGFLQKLAARELAGIVRFRYLQSHLEAGLRLCFVTGREQSLSDKSVHDYAGMGRKLRRKAVQSFADDLEISHRIGHAKGGSCLGWKILRSKCHDD